MTTTLTTYLDAPCPRVDIFIENLDPGVAFVTVYRIANRREFPVRGAVMAPVVGSLSRIDFEVPFNTEVTYRTELFDAAGLSLGFAPSASVTVTVGETWLHNPLDPQGAVPVMLMDTAARALSRPVPGEISYPSGRRVGVVLSEPRQGLRNGVFDVFCSTFEDADRVQAMLGDYSLAQVPVLCLRVGSNMRVTSPLFLGVLDIVEEDFDVRLGGEGTVQRITGDEVAPPTPGLFIPLLIRNDIDAFYSTRDALDAAYLRRMDIDRDYSLAGAASE